MSELKARTVGEWQAQAKREFDIATGYHTRWQDAEERLRKVVDRISSALCLMAEGPEVMRSADLRRVVEQELLAAIAAAQPEKRGP